MTTLPAVHPPFDFDEFLTGSFAEQRQEQADRSMRYSANQPRDDDGKFGSGSGSSKAKAATAKTIDGAGYKPGAWRPATHEQRLQQVAEQIAPNIRMKSWDYTHGGYKMSEAESLKQAKVRAGELVGGHDEKLLVNGPHWIAASQNVTISDREMAHLGSLADGHLARNPIPDGQSLQLLVQNGWTMQSHLGETDVHTGRITLNDTLFFSRNLKLSGMMPAAKKVPAVDYIMAHEWGHTQSLLGDPRVDKIFDRADPKMSPYSHGEAHEAYAEAFAEFTLSKGATRNATVKKYAATFGWKA
jgi:hypothetical protein